MTEEEARAFLDRLWAIQEREGMSTYRLAKEIGCSQSYLGRMKKGERGQRLSINFVLRVARRFPELALFLGHRD